MKQQQQMGANSNNMRALSWALMFAQRKYMATTTTTAAATGTQSQLQL